MKNSDTHRQRAYDVIGVGITGISTALGLQNAGYSCLPLEARTADLGLRAVPQRI